MATLNPMPSYNNHRLLRMKDAEKVKKFNKYFSLFYFCPNNIFFLCSFYRSMILMKMMRIVCSSSNGSGEDG